MSDKTNSALQHAFEVVESLPEDDQDLLIDEMRRRLAERRQAQLLDDVEAGRAEYAAGKLRPMTVEEIMREITS